MAKLCRVWVRDDWRWDRAQVSGREFTKAGEVMSAGLLDEEMLSSPLLEITVLEKEAPAEEAEPEPRPKRSRKSAGGE